MHVSCRRIKLHPFSEDLNELSLINDKESNATLLHSPTSTVVSLGDCVIDRHHHLTVQHVQQVSEST